MFLADMWQDCLKIKAPGPRTVSRDVLYVVVIAALLLAYLGGIDRLLLAVGGFVARFRGRSIGAPATIH